MLGGGWWWACIYGSFRQASSTFGGRWRFCRTVGWTGPWRPCPCFPSTPCALTSPLTTCWWPSRQNSAWEGCRAWTCHLWAWSCCGLGAEAEVDDLGSITLLFIKTHDPLLRLVDGLSYADDLSAPKDLGRLSINLSAKHSIFDKLPGSWLLRDVFCCFPWGRSWFLSFAASRENLVFSSLYYLEEVVCLLGRKVVLGTEPSELPSLN